jgi:hypothetical protein
MESKQSAHLACLQMTYDNRHKPALHNSVQ